MERAYICTANGINAVTYLFLGVFFIQLYHGLYLDLVTWKYEIDPPLVAITEFTIVYSLAILLLFLANCLFIGLNYLWLGVVRSASFVYFKFIVGASLIDLYVILFVTKNYPQNVNILYAVYSPLLYGFALNKVIKPTPFATLHILSSLRSLLQNMVHRIRVGL